VTVRRKEAASSTFIFMRKMLLCTYIHARNRSSVHDLMRVRLPVCELNVCAPEESSVDISNVDEISSRPRLPHPPPTPYPPQHFETSLETSHLSITPSSRFRSRHCMRILNLRKKMANLLSDHSRLILSEVCRVETRTSFFGSTFDFDQ
jgi:hypothetical protein